MPSTDFRSVATATSESASFLTLTKPTGVVEGDVLLVSISRLNTTAWTGTPPAGWTIIRSVVFGASYGANNQIDFVKIAGASEPASYQFNVAGQTLTGIITCWEKCLLDVSSASGSNSHPAVAPSVNAAGIGRLIVMSSNIVGSGSASNSSIPPSGMVERADISRTYWDGSSQWIGSQSHADKSIPGGATGTQTTAYNIASGYWVSTALVLLRTDLGGPRMMI